MLNRQRRFLRWTAIPLLLCPLALACSSDNETPSEQKTEQQSPEEFLAEEVRSAKSCALRCDQPCDELQHPFECPALRPWDQIPHADSCQQQRDEPAPQASGQCKATVPAGDAVTKTNPSGSPVVLPDGRTLKPAGKTWVFPNEDLAGTFPFSMVWVPKSPYVVVSDDGYRDHAIRLVDLRKLASGEDPTADTVPFKYPRSLNYGLALSPDGILYAASGRGESSIYAFTIDTTAGKITRDKSKDILIGDKPGDAFPSGIAISGDGSNLLVAQVRTTDATLVDLSSGNYGKQLATFSTPSKDQFAAAFDPFNPSVGYVSLWIKRGIQEVNLDTKQTRFIETGAQPHEMAFLDANYMAVADALGDDIAIVDRVAGKVVQALPVDPNAKTSAQSPTAIAYDDATGRLYATLASRNGVAAYQVEPSQKAGSPPSFTHLGIMPTLWWPTDVLVTGEGSPKPGAVVILSGKGVGGGAYKPKSGPGHYVLGPQMHGGIQLVTSPDAGWLAKQTTAFESTQHMGSNDGVARVTCLDGASYDFPVPRTNTEGPSKYIKHIIFVLRENKTYDAIMGDVSDGGADGDPALVMIPGKMKHAFGNIQKLAKTFSHGDNFYHDAEASIQGHYWTVFGRSSDYTERTWLSTWGRRTREFPLQGLEKGTIPDEGSIFDWLQRNKVPFDNMGELFGMAKLDPRYGTSGLVSVDSTRPDTLNTCYVAGRALVTCDLKPFTFVWLPNDHTMGGKAHAPNPGLMIAVNDEATGLLVDAISHSPIWKDSLVIIIEDDPQTGGDHVDTHRSIMVMASPWIKRGYVSHGHYDPTSLHKLISNILGIPYNNGLVQQAALPFDMFTSTPDMTPFAYVRRTWDDHSCNKARTRAAKEAAQWDFTDPDEQPGLSDQLWRMFHGEQR